MSWTDPDTLSSSFDTNDIPTQGNFDSIFNNFESVSHILDTEFSDLDVVNTTSETTIYSVTIPANSMGTDGEVYMEIFGDLRTNTTDAITFRYKFGGTTVFNSGAINYATTTRQAQNLGIRMFNQGSTNAQLVQAARSDSVTGPSPAAVQWSAPATAAIDTTVDQTLLISVQWSTANANNSVRRLSARTTLAQN